MLMHSVFFSRSLCFVITLVLPSYTFSYSLLTLSNDYQLIMKSLTQSTKETATRQLRQGKSTREVSRNLRISVSSVIRVRKEDKENIPEPHPGRPRKISTKTRENLARHFMRGDLRSLKDGQRFVESVEGEHVHITTVQKNLRLEGIRAYTQPNKPKLTQEQIAKRLQFAKEHIHWTVEEWRNVMFSDECSISRIGSFGKKYYYHKRQQQQYLPHQVQPKQQGGGKKMMVWGCIAYSGVGDLCWIEGTMDTDTYVDVLNRRVRQSRKYLGMDKETFIFQQDNASAHTALRARNFFVRHRINVLIWPPNSPDLNLIEHVWAYIKRELDKYPESPRDLDELWRRVEAIWREIPMDFLHKLYESMPDRLAMVIQNKGRNTKY